MDFEDKLEIQIGQSYKSGSGVQLGRLQVTTTEEWSIIVHVLKLWPHLWELVNPTVLT